jgi:hypothetical protein
MLYTGQLNEFIRLAEIDNTNCDLLKENQTTVIWALDELKLKWTEANTFPNTVLFLTEYHKVAVLSVRR